MIKTFAVIAALSFSLAANADEWTGPDKTKHFLGGAAIGAAVTLATDKPEYGIAAGILVGVAKEAYDDRHRNKHTVSIKDLLLTVAGSAVGSYAGSLIIKKDFIGIQTTF